MSPALGRLLVPPGMSQLCGTSSEGGSWQGLSELLVQQGPRGRTLQELVGASLGVHGTRALSLSVELLASLAR